MNQYRVTWGEEVVLVEAADEAEAWAKFCEGHDVARKHPKMHERKVEEIKPAPVKEAVSKPVRSPVEDLLAHDAIEKIGHMRSVDSLQKIVDNDTRSTLTEAAQKQLDEISGR